MDFGVYEVFQLAGALGLFVIGMKIMSESIQRITGPYLRQMLSGMKSNRFSAMFAGFASTALVQSSSAITVMVVSFVNAGILKLKQAISVIMGANIGTTITIWLMAILAFGDFSVLSFAMPIIAIGLPLLFFKRDGYKYTGEMLMGFAVLFIGLEFLKLSVPVIDLSSAVGMFLADFGELTFLSTVMFVLIGMLLTIVVQSSSAAIALTIVLLFKDYLSLEMAAAMVAGENVGTTITANIAAVIGNAHAKRAARAHLIFNLFGIAWIILFFPQFVSFISWVFDGVHSIFVGGDQAAANTLKLAFFHTAFNLFATLILLWFTKLISRVVIRMIPSKGDDEIFTLEYIGAGVMGTPELSLLEAYKEAAKFGKITSRMSEFVSQILEETDGRTKKKLLKKIKKYEEITDRVEVEIANYLGQVSRGEMSPRTSVRVRGLLSIANDLERIGDIYYQMSLTLENKDEKKVYFLPEQRENLKKMFELVDEAFVIMVENLKTESEKVDIKPAKEKEREIDNFRDELRSQHLRDIEQKKYGINSGMIYIDLFSQLEKVGDHIINVSEGIIGEV
ncbi:Na/Pi cotransporter family protein [Halocola ammonii]